MIEVVVVAPYPLVRAGLRALLEAAPELAIVGEAAGVAEAADLVAELAPAVAVLDLGAAPDDDLRALHALAQEQPTLGLVILVEPGLERRLPALGRGRLAYLPRQTRPETLVAAVRAVASGLIVLDPLAVPGLVAAPPRALPEPPLDPLTAREREVLALLARGLPNKAIAQQLGISEHTVKFHVGTILAKLGAASRTEAVTLAARQGLLML
ncbi:MAG TPA: response regulator transcription factor [Chloroflexota bacterium]|nr:response regulator transcription factor [Chloroflexota bacterium]